jgi:hypothetical protein
VIHKIGEERHTLNEFEKNAQEIINGYRSFTTEDYKDFTFPEGYQPIAVTNSEEFAIGFKEINGKVEVCFQLSNTDIIKQINHIKAANTEKIRKLELENQSLSEKLAHYDTEI